MDEYLLAIALTTVGFFALAALLLVPVWRFLKREEEISRLWTDETVRTPSDEGIRSSDGSDGGSGDGQAPHGSLTNA